MNQIAIGKMIAELRKSKNLTQQELGEKIGVGIKTISKWERGVTYPDIAIIKDLADVLGVTPDKLLSGENNDDDEYFDNLEDKDDKIIRILSICLVVLNIIIIALLIILIVVIKNKFF